MTVIHDNFKTISMDNLIGMMKNNPILIDVRGFYSEEAKIRNIIYRKL